MRESVLAAGNLVHAPRRRKKNVPRETDRDEHAHVIAVLDSSGVDDRPNVLRSEMRDRRSATKHSPENAVLRPRLAMAGEKRERRCTSTRSGASALRGGFRALARSGCRGYFLLNLATAGVPSPIASSPSKSQFWRQDSSMDISSSRRLPFHRNAVPLDRTKFAAIASVGTKV